MASDTETVRWILEELRPLDVRAQAMFGEYGLYCNDIFVGVICRNTLFLKRNPVTDEAFGVMNLAPPYDGARDHHVIKIEHLCAAGDLVREAVSGAAEVLPRPRKRR